MRPRHNSNRTVIAAAILAAATACVPSPDDYSDFRTLPDEGWAYTHHLTFTPEIADSASRGTMLVAVRHSGDFNYRNIWLEIAATMPDGTVRRDTIDIELADKFGTWLGSGPGTSFQKADTLPRPYTLVDSATIELRHIMRIDTLHGIEQVGLIFKSDRQSCNN